MRCTYYFPKRARVRVRDGSVGKGYKNGEWKGPHSGRQQSETPVSSSVTNAMGMRKRDSH